MNKLVKAGIATGFATALLLGGAQTLALWNDSATVASSRSISTGTLTIDASPGSWDANPALWVPGDSMTYTTDVTIVATGDNLRSELAIDPTSLTGTPELLAVLDTSMSVSGVQGGTLTPHATAENVFVVDQTGTAPITATVTVTVAFPASVAGLVAQGATADLSSLAIDLSQVP